MPGFARRETVDENEVQLHHCVSRCVRRAWLCGKDPLTGANHDHRRGWIQDRFAELAAIFAVDLGFFAVLSNHFHLIVRTRPDLARQWSDTEVARRWWRLFPGRRDARGRPAEPTAAELNVLMHDKARLKELRRRLASLSWLMRCLNEHIARRANREDEVSGRFWEGRFKNQRLDTISALLVCALYVDLNLIRAGIAKTPEASRDTSASLRLRAKRFRRRSGSRRLRDDWLAPLTLREGPQANKSETRSSQARASNRGMLPLSAVKYFTLLDWVGRQLVAGKRGAIPAQLAPILERQQIASDRWLDAVAGFGRMFGRVVGPAEQLQSAAASAGKSWFQGLRRCQEVFG